jgi:hypothetical protein
MMYGNKLAAAIKVNGKVLREFKDTVYIPFGSEYTILVKNLNTRKVIVNVFLDGENAVPGGLVLSAGQEVDLERWIKNGNLSDGNRFKFIERTQAIEDGPRGIKIEDGLIRIEYNFEKEVPKPTWNDYNKFHNPTPTWPNTPFYGGVNGSMGSSEYKGTTDKFTLTASGTISQMNVGGVLRGVDYSNGESVKATAAAAINKVAPDSIEYHSGMATMDWCDTGITVPGSHSAQKFSIAGWFPTETETHNLIIKLLGDLGDNKPVTKPVTVKHKVKCVTCGRQNKHNAKFCTECGTALEIFA